MEMAVIGDSTTVLGFHLAGIRISLSSPSREELSGFIRNLAKEGKTGLILITERLAETARKEIREIRSEYPRLVITEIPDPQGPVHREVDPIQALLRRTLGAQINP